MSLVAKETGGVQIEPIPAGTYTAVCYGVIDLGTHTNPTFNKDAHKVLVQWEVPSVMIDVNRDGETVSLPRAISKKYTMSLHQKAALRHDLESWRGKAFTAGELAGFDVSKLISAACMVCIVHEPSKDGTKTYANIKSIMAMPKGGNRPKPVNDCMVFAIPDNAPAGFDIPEDKLPEWIVNLIKDSKEYRGEMAWQTGHEQPPDMPDADAAPGSEEEDNLPF
jgi:hypothetical protein